MAKHILTVDDENNIRRLVEVNLIRAGYQVTGACDGVDALERIQANRPDMVVLDVFDDGRGFDPSAAALSEPAGPSGPDGGTGYGLRAMRDRARALGGTLTVESSPGEGTAVVASLPLPAGPDDPERGEHR